MARSAFKIDANHDLSVVNGRLELVTGSEEVAQRIKTRVLFIKGESLTDKDYGVDYFGRVFGGGPGRKVIADAELKRIVAETDGVRRMRSFTSTLNRSTRALSIETRVEYDDGTEGVLTIEGVT